MKKLLLLLVVLSPICLWAQKEVEGTLITMKNGGAGFKIETDTIAVSFNPGWYFWDINIKNKIKSDIQIIWDKCSFITNGQSSKIAFNYPSGFGQGNVLPDEEVPSQSFIAKRIMSSKTLGSDLPTISKRDVSKRFKLTGKPDSISIVLLVKINSEINRHQFDFKIQPKQKN